jgi:hypothetical protein
MNRNDAITRIKGLEPWLRHGRRFHPNEVEEAVAKVYRIENRQRGMRGPGDSASEWSAAATRTIHADLGCERADLWEKSPIRVDDGLSQAYILAALFPDPKGLLWIGRSKSHGRTATLSEHADVRDCQFIIPAYMTAPEGITADGKTSMRSKSNTGPRRFIVLDFDAPPAGEHPSIVMHLREFGRLVLVMTTGGKGLHAWFAVSSNDEEDKEFWGLAIRLGADPALFRNSSQLVRLPEGLRDNGNRQRVLYFEP